MVLVMVRLIQTGMGVIRPIRTDTVGIIQTRVIQIDIIMAMPSLTRMVTVRVIQMDIMEDIINMASHTPRRWLLFRHG
jgi:hypothetical protein